MAKTYKSNQWTDAPEGYRFSLTGIDETLWMPLSEAISLLAGLNLPTIRPLHQYFAWRCEHGLISAKAGRLALRRASGSLRNADQCSMPIG